MAVSVKKSDSSTEVDFQWPFGRRNYIFFAIALVVIILGYIFLAKGSITLAPLLLVIGYCVLVPVSLIIKDPAKYKDSSPEDNTQ